MTAVWTVHVAAPPVGAIQTCVACGFTLQDNTPWFEGRVAVLEGDERGMSWWPTGERIATVPGVTFAMDADTPLTADERLCVGAN